MNQPIDTTPSCKCYVIEQHHPCPVHGLDRSQTTERPGLKAAKSPRVVNTSTSFRKPAA